MTIALIIFICLLIGIATSAGSFCWGYQVGILKKNSDDDKLYLKQATDHIKQMEQYVEQLEFDKKELQRDSKREPTAKSHGWNPLDLADRR